MSAQVLQTAVIYYLWFLLSLTVHEWGHAKVAYALGDDTSFIEGRVTLNPLAHISFLGTIVMPLVMLLVPGKIAILGWAKPVPVNPLKMRGGEWGDVLCSVMGPLMNFVLAFVILLLGFFVERYGESWRVLCIEGMEVNVALGLFNLLPIPPLDGAHLLKVLTRMKEETFLAFSQVGVFVLLLLINLPAFMALFDKLYYVTLNGFWKVGLSLVEFLGI